MPTALARLFRLLDVEEIEVDLYRGANTDAGWSRVYGGQVVAQALAAAQRTVPEDRPAHSLHSYFIRPGEPRIPILYKVERERDGASFTTRRVTAIQHGRAIFSLAASFQIREPGFQHHDPMPASVGPEGLLSDREWTEKADEKIPEPWRSILATRDRPFEFRPLHPINPMNPRVLPPATQNWFRADGEVPDDHRLRAAIFAYATDMTLLDTCLLPHGVSWTDPKLQSASLDHAIWFHQDTDPSEWHLYDQHSPAASGGRGLNIGKIFSQRGQLVATVVQEGLIRYRD
ncbi:acyl-CoA thioesterase II [Sandaracinobacter sp. RS1-74]|uniref:acyl-CoA thioesterase n=1 Tax=Sandaracinobacteroides sayramensis TaxID=2913411 RepID=UPI001EDB29EA|nr:acyl-CoA thioesterase II [Sandaracinobacteroides sayramensis]MCG2842540.1 acyl-CoA thioesterase II [Sandaracinobacteroides sayramensis]